LTGKSRLITLQITLYRYFAQLSGAIKIKPVTVLLITQGTITLPALLRKACLAIARHLLVMHLLELSAATE
jgi:hypothetical protein